MFGKISGIVLFSMCAVLCTYTMGVWWLEFGVREVYPYIMTFMAALMWWLVYITATEKED